MEHHLIGHTSIEEMADRLWAYTDSVKDEEFTKHFCIVFNAALDDVKDGQDIIKAIYNDVKKSIKHMNMQRDVQEARKENNDDYFQLMLIKPSWVIAQLCAMEEDFPVNSKTTRLFLFRLNNWIETNWQKWIKEATKLYKAAKEEVKRGAEVKHNIGGKNARGSKKSS
jgi:hypothetical protein